MLSGSFSDQLLVLKVILAKGVIVAVLSEKSELFFNVFQ